MYDLIGLKLQASVHFGTLQRKFGRNDSECKNVQRNCRFLICENRLPCCATGWFDFRLFHEFRLSNLIYLRNIIDKNWDKNNKTVYLTLENFITINKVSKYSWALASVASDALTRQLSENKNNTRHLQ